MDKTTLSEETQLFFQCCTPAELKRNINTLFFSFVINHHDVLPVDFKDMAENISVLNEFLEKVEKIITAKET